MLCSSPCYRAALSVLAVLVWLSPGTAAGCQTNVVYTYDSEGQLIDIDVVCIQAGGGCGNPQDNCVVVVDGPLIWCACMPSGTGDACIGVVAANGMRCVNENCGNTCLLNKFVWTSPETGKVHEQYSCSCP